MYRVCTSHAVYILMCVHYRYFRYMSTQKERMTSFSISLYHRSTAQTYIYYSHIKLDNKWRPGEKQVVNKRMLDISGGNRCWGFGLFPIKNLWLRNDFRWSAFAQQFWYSFSLFILYSVFLARTILRPDLL